MSNLDKIFLIKVKFNLPLFSLIYPISSPIYVFFLNETRPFYHEKEESEKDDGEKKNSFLSLTDAKL